MLQKRCNEHHCSGRVKKKVIKLMSSNPDTEYSAKQIAVLIGERSSSVRSCLWRLLRENYVVRTHRGFYRWSNVARARDGVGELPRVHNLILSLKPPNNVKPPEHKEYRFKIDGGKVKIRLCYGEKRRKITIWISCDEGLDDKKLNETLDKIWSTISDLYQFKPSEDKVMVRSYELNKDYVACRIDGVKCVTLKDFRGWFMRIYQKEPNVVRCEIKGRNMTLDQLYNSLSVGLMPYNISQTLSTLTDRVEKLTEAIKFQNGLILNTSKSMEKSIFRILDNISDMKRKI
ncbi:hypothetical protein J7L27_05165, partial [Candidatus Bathyarchaeota archaeon]|nr:hypothetical protein [Candidatus Bathyarchaeota archaeon]